MKNMSKKVQSKLQAMSTKAYLILKNQRGDANSSSQLMWIVIVVAIVVLAWTTINGFMPKVFKKMETEVNTMLKLGQ